MNFNDDFDKTFNEQFKTVQKTAKVGIAVAIGWFLLCAGIAAGAIFIVLHYVVKYW